MSAPTPQPEPRRRSLTLPAASPAHPVDVDWLLSASPAEIAQRLADEGFELFPITHQETP